MELMEIKGFQGKFQIPIYTVNTIGDSLPATPTGGSYSGGTLTVPTSQDLHGVNQYLLMIVLLKR